MDGFPLGKVVDLRAGAAQADDPQQGGSWPGHRTVRAETISALLRGAADVEALHRAMWTAAVGRGPETDG